MHRKILVTGGTGLTGRALSDIEAQYPGREFIYLGSKDCDLTRLDETCDLVGQYQPDAILHLAAVAGGIGLSMKVTATLLRDNVFMNLNVLEAARKHGVAKTVMSLSVGMYPEHAPLPLREESMHLGLPHASNYSYAYAKRLVEPSITAYREEYGMNVIGLIPNGIFGEHSDYRRDRAVMLAALIRRFYENRNSSEPLVVWGDGTPRREYTYARDLARAYMWCLDHYNEAQVLNVGSNEEHSVGDIAKMIATSLDIDPARIQFDTSKPKGIFRRSTDNSRFVDASKFEYTPLHEGLDRTIKYFVEHYESGAVRL